MSNIRTRRVGKHKVNCFAWDNVKEGDWPNAWGVATDNALYLDKRGGKGGHTTRWIEVSCNDPGCDAKLLIAFDDVIQEAGVIA